ncbi:MAG: FkbM family methyltransferase [Phycisphaerales bacterium]|nr:FkbM family methyltransferase [Phycisphaerales bacterium]
MLKRLPKGGTAVDIGAHKGAYTYWMARQVGPSGRVIAVEPQASLCTRLRAEFAAIPAISIVHAAAAATKGELTLSLRGNGSSHGASIHGFPDEPDAPTIRVPAVSLRSLVDDHQLTRLDFIKCDCEGAELEILSAAVPLLSTLRPAVLCEAEARHHSGSSPVNQLVDLFSAAGYSAHFAYGRSLLPFTAFDADVHQQAGKRPYANNFLFLPPPA